MNIVPLLPKFDHAFDKLFMEIESMWSLKK